MALNSLILTEDFRPWHRAGLSCLFWEHSEAAPFLFDADPSCVALDDALQQQIFFTQSAVNDGPRPALKGRAAASPEALRRKEHGTAAPLPVDQGIKRQGDTGASTQSSACVSVADWPQAWRELLARTAAAPIVWTYAELGEDLVGPGNKARSACLRQIIGALQLAKGSSAFWPLCMPRLGDAEVPGGERAIVDGLAPAHPGDTGSAFCVAAPSPEHMLESRLFQEGLRILAPRIVIMLGASSMELANLPPSVPFSQQVYMGVLYVLLPDFSSLLASAQLQEQTCIFVRSVLADLLPAS